MKALLSLENITKYYGQGTNVTKALDSVTLTMQKGEFIAIMGASGSGKSTLLNVISTIDSPSSGSVFINDICTSNMKEKDLAAFRRDELGFVFQEYNLVDTLTVEENIILPLCLKKEDSKDIRRKLRSISEKLEITEQLSKFPRDLSGGQRQRAACARALITEPSLILADEPTGALDSANSKRLMETFSTMNKSMGASIFMVTHDAMMGSYADKILFLKDGRIWNELLRGDKKRSVMYHEILDTMAVLGGEADVR